MSFVSFIKCNQCGEKGEFQRHALSANAVPQGWFHVTTGELFSGHHFCSWKCLNQYSLDGMSGESVRLEKQAVG